MRHFETPTLDPRLAGFVKAGRPTASCARRKTACGSRANSASPTAIHGVTGMPAFANTGFCKDLSIPSALAATPAPT